MFQILYLEGVTFEKPELQTKIEPEFSGGPQVSQFVALTRQLLQGRLNGANGSGSVHLHCDTIRPKKYLTLSYLSKKDQEKIFTV